MDDVVLRYVADHAAELPQVGAQVDPIEAHRSRGGRSHAGDRLQQRRLSGTADTDYGDELTGPDRERHGVQKGDLTSATDLDAPRQLVDFDAEALG